MSVTQGQGGVHGGLLDEGQQRGCDELAHVGQRGAQSHRGREVAGACIGKQSRGDGLGHHVKGQLVHHTLESVGCCHRGQSCIVGRSDAWSSSLLSWDGWPA